MKLILKDGTAMNNVVCGEKMIEINYQEYSEVATIYTAVTYDNLNGAHWETTTGVTMGRYSNVIISNSITDIIKRKVRFTLVESTTAEIESLKKELNQIKAQYETTINDYDDTVISLANELAGMI